MERGSQRLVERSNCGVCGTIDRGQGNLLVQVDIGIQLIDAVTQLYSVPSHSRTYGAGYVVPAIHLGGDITSGSAKLSHR